MSDYAFNGICIDCPHFISGKESDDPMSSLVYKCSLTDTYVDPISLCKCYINEHEEEPKNETPNLDIHKIIDKAIEKNDRSVSIFISPNGITINVCPYENEEPKWIYHEHDNDYNFECSECGSISEFPTPYCPHCGEKLKNPDRKEITDDTY